MSNMKMARFENGDRMPMLGLGTWKSDPGDAYAAVREAIRQGYRHIDCAPVYGNEAEIGKALSECFAAGSVKREDLWITSKLWCDSHAPDDVRPALERTLESLRVDYVDLWLVHWPVSIRKGVGFPKSADDFISPADLPLAKTWTGMEAVVDAGLARHIGLSNCSSVKVQEVLDSARIRPEVNQVELHPYLQQGKLVDFCREHGVWMTAYSPLGSPDRPAMFKQSDELVLMQDPVIVEIAERHGATPAQVLLAWALHRETVVIPKATSPEHIAQNLGALDIALSPADVEAIAGLDRHRRYVTGEIWAQESGPYTIANLWDE